MTEISLNKYQDGKIYKITNRVDELFYIGSTYKSLSERINNHKSCQNDFVHHQSCFYNHMRNIGIDYFEIQLVENYPCESLLELTTDTRNTLD